MASSLWPERGVANADESRCFVVMSMTLQQIVSEARQLPREQLSELFDLLLAESFAQPDAEIDAAWRTETGRRVADIHAGRVRGVPGEQVMAELRKTVGL